MKGFISDSGDGTLHQTERPRLSGLHVDLATTFCCVKDSLVLEPANVKSDLFARHSSEWDSRWCPWLPSLICLDFPSFFCLHSVRWSHCRCSSSCVLADHSFICNVIQYRIIRSYRRCTITTRRCQPFPWCVRVRSSACCASRCWHGHNRLHNGITLVPQSGCLSKRHHVSSRW